jgi:hypothetical protein
MTMLTILGERRGGRFCDGLSRRSFLQIGGLAMGGLSLPQILQAESSGRISRSSQTAGNGDRSHKAVIMIFLPGGPPHQDMFDLKMDAPKEIRGEFQPIPTNVPGIEIGELFPRIARMADKFTFIRSMVGATGSHYSFQCLTGRDHRNQPQGGWPSIGAHLSSFEGPVDPSVPAFVGMAPAMGHKPWSDPGQAGFLGISHAPFRPTGQGKADMTLNGVTLERLGDRERLLTSFDRFRRETDNSGVMDGLDAFNRQAFGILTSSRLARALDISGESPRVREQYGKGKPKNVADGGPRILEQFLMALAFSRWDWHGGNFRRAREDMPMLDQGVSALVDDLHQRGLDRDVSVVVWGEFGRTPKINKGAGRDHWPRVSTALLACGGLRHGQVIGSTNRLGEHAKDRPVRFSEVHATLYHALGIDVNTATLKDLNGRPHYLVDAGTQPMKELV